MTPRALITAIGTTAIAFAAVVASLSTGPAASPEATAPAAATVRAAAYAVQTGPWNEDCVIAV